VKPPSVKGWAPGKGATGDRPQDSLPAEGALQLLPEETTDQGQRTPGPDKGIHAGRTALPKGTLTA